MTDRVKQIRKYNLIKKNKLIDWDDVIGVRCGYITLVTNQQEFLSEVIQNILPGSKKLYFLVGYFYFSGFEEIYEQIGNKHLKILVGMNIEKDLSNNIKEFFVLQELNKSRLEIKKN